MIPVSGHQGHQGHENDAELNMTRIIAHSQQLQLHMAWTEGQCGAQCPIYDMGRSTFDVSPLTIDMHFEVKATAGDIRLEDEDFDMNV